MTITVKQLRDELLKFRDDALCYAYEGEVRGIIVSPPGGWGGPGVIHCGNETAPEDPKTEVFETVARQPPKPEGKPHA